VHDHAAFCWLCIEAACCHAPYLFLLLQAIEPAQHTPYGRPQGRPDSAKTAAGQQNGSASVKEAFATPFAAAKAQSAIETPLQTAASAQRTPMQNGAATPKMNGVKEQKVEPEILKKLLVANGILEAAAEKGVQRGAPYLASEVFPTRAI
jgi:hypothetical protein